jgi:hypothetical protein
MDNDARTQSRCKTRHRGYFYMQQPTEKSIVRRALCLGAVVERGEIENYIHSVDESEEIEKLEQTAWSLTNWLEDYNLLIYLSQAEMSLIHKIPGQWKNSEIISVGWRAEALGTILWALSFIETIPSYDVKFNRTQILELLGIERSPVEFVQCALLRPSIELQRARSTAEVWQWRSETRRRQNARVHGTSMAALGGRIRTAAENAYYDRYIPRPINGDFPAFGKPYSALTPGEFARASSIAYQRLFALNWLCGHSPAWDHTPTHTNS